MITITKEEAVKKIQKWAESIGSKAHTLAGQKRAILTSLKPRVLITQRIHSQYRDAQRIQQYLVQREQDRACRIAEALGLPDLEQITIQHTPELQKMKWPYRRSHSSWAGGDHCVSYTCALVPSASGGSSTAWSKNGKWRGTNSHAEIKYTPDAINLFPTLRTPDGSMIIDADMISSREYKITWVEQGVGFDLKTVQGYLIKGYHIRATSIEKARRRVQKIRRDAALKILRGRQEKKDLCLIWVGIDDSLRAGNCKSQTEAYVARLCEHFRGAIGGIRADVLLSLRDDIYTRRAVLVAKARQRG